MKFNEDSKEYSPDNTKKATISPINNNGKSDKLPVIVGTCSQFSIHSK